MMKNLIVYGVLQHNSVCTVVDTEEKAVKLVRAGNALFSQFGDNEPFSYTEINIKDVIEEVRSHFAVGTPNYIEILIKALENYMEEDDDGKEQGCDTAW